MLRIAVLTAHFPSSDRPSDGRSVYETLRVLSAKCEVQVFYPQVAYLDVLKGQPRLHPSCRHSIPSSNVNVTYCKYPALRLVSRPVNGFIAARTLCRPICEYAPDVILSYFLYPDAYAALKIAKSLTVPVVAVGVGSDLHSVRDRFSRMHTSRVLREADRLLTVSEDLRGKALAMGALPEKTSAILNGCDTSVFCTGNRADARAKVGIDTATEAIVYIGRTDLKKGLRELVEAAAALHPVRPNLHVYMVGEGPDAPLIGDHIRQHRAAEYVHLMPRCSFDEVAVWMAAADIVTLPSYMEGCPNVVLEALACGRPVVATNVGGIPEILSDECGRLVPPRDPNALAEGLASALATPWDEAAISARGSRSWNDVADELLGILESLVSARRTLAHGR